MELAKKSNLLKLVYIYILRFLRSYNIVKRKYHIRRESFLKSKRNTILKYDSSKLCNSLTQFYIFCLGSMRFYVYMEFDLNINTDELLI